jgi:D-amino-acid dehydrogenase
MSKHVVIIGSGVIGLSTAYYCAQRGHRVTVIERSPMQRDGCSFGNAGMIVPSHFVPLAAPGMVALGLKWMWNPESPFYIKPRLNLDLLDWAWKFWQASTLQRVAKAAPLLRDLNFASRACFEELASNLDDFALVKRGLLMYCKTQHALDEEAKFAKQANELGISAEVLDSKKASELDPSITVDVAGAVYFRKDCHLSPDRFMASLLSACQATGVDFEWNADVTSIEHTQSRIHSLKTEDKTFEGDEYVICGGSWSPQLAAQLGLRIPLQAGKGYSLTLLKPPQLPQMCSIFTEARLAITPMNGALRIGGTMEIAGLNETINPARVRGIMKSIPQYFPAFSEQDFAGITPWRGLRPCSPDGLPYVGRTTKFTNLSLATGHAMMGLSLGPITGKLMSQVMSGEVAEYDLSLLSPDRYA